MKIKALFLGMLISITSCVDSNKKLLFNEDNLQGWKNYGTEKWYVENEMLVCENGVDEAFGYLGTINEYKNFELNLEFKKGIKSNGGVFIHSKINGTKIEGWQVEIAIPEHYTGGIHEYERGWLVKPDPKKDSVVNLEGWNKMKIIVKGDILTSWINGVEMATIVDEKLKITKGSIALQIHKGNVNKIEWRNIEITEL